jgi:hypothetical protein
VEGVSERTGGVPLFVEEVTRLLLERGEQGGVQAIPPTLQQSLAARLDRLGPAREVAQIGALMVQHYVAEVYEPRHCRMVSLSDVQTPAGWTKIQVIWDLSVTALGSASCRFTNQVLSYPTPAFLETLKVAGISFEDAVADRQAAGADHNRRETALYAQSIERKALARN